MAMLASTPSWKEQPDDQETRCRHFVVSPSFAGAFSRIRPESLRGQLDANARRRPGGIVADFALGLTDDNGTLHEFQAESFFNRYYLQTLFVRRSAVTSRNLLLSGNGRIRKAPRRT